MRALLVIDVQQGFVDAGNFAAMVDRIEQLVHVFKKNNEPVFFIRHHDEDSHSLIQEGTPGSKICCQLAPYVTDTVAKRLPSAFYHTDLNSKLEKATIDEVVLCGFNAEYCILFNAVAAFEHEYKVCVVEDACASVNTGENYEMNDLDIRDFVCTVLYNSGEVTVNDLSEFLQKSQDEYAPN
ncbi:isochorismatase family protein [Sporolactobacillus sp. STCC-11]|jgi:nicotinamidase-related amidase|uniref:isochorismatase family protein n=1 Tax=Sporolactobacillus caesalpiniae TaxID=3230362 RepID=UPI0033917C6A